MKAEIDPDFNPKTYWLDEKTGTLLRVVTDVANGGGVFRDENDRRRKFVMVSYISDGCTGVRFRVSVTDMRDRFKPMGSNPVYIRSEKRWISTKEARWSTSEHARTYRDSLP